MISDRFHLYKGLTDALRKFVLSFVQMRTAISSDTVASTYWQKPPRNETDLPERLHNATVEKRAKVAEEILELKVQGFNIEQIFNIFFNNSRFSTQKWSCYKPIIVIGLQQPPML